MLDEIRNSILSRRAIVAAGVFFLLFGGSAAYAICVPSVYILNAGAPASSNWTDTSGAVWSPSGGFPGCAPGDAVQAVNGSGKTLIINSSIPNAIIGLNLSCPSCTIDVQAGGALSIAGAAAIQSSDIVKVSGGTLTVASPGTITFLSGSDFQLYGGVTSILTGGKIVMRSNGMVGWNGDLQLNGGQLTMDAGTTITLDSGSFLTLNSGVIDGTGSIDNGGTVVKNTSSNFNFGAALNNLGGATGVQVNDGSLSLTGGGNGNAPFAIATGATLDFPSNSYTMTPNGVVSGGGTLRVSGGTLSIGGVTSPNRYEMTAGTLTGAGFLAVNLMDWSGGTITGSGGTQINGSGTGNFTGNDGVMQLDGRDFDVIGYVNYTATTNPLNLANGARLDIFGTFDIEDDGGITCSCANPPAITVAPNGFLQKSGGTGISAIEVPTSNTATVSGNSGILKFEADATHTGAFFTGADGEIAFAAGTTTFNGGFIGGDGTYWFPTGSADIDAFYSVNGLTKITGATVTIISSGATTKDFTFTSGNFFLENDFHMTGTGLWSGGEMGDVSSFYVNSGATMTIDAANGDPEIDSIEFVNDGTVSYTAAASPGNNLRTDDATITNNGLWDIQTDQDILETGSSPVTRAKGVRALEADSTIKNYGTWQKSSGSGTTAIDPSFTNDGGNVLAQSGTMQFNDSFQQASGTTSLEGGNLSGDTFVFNGGLLKGSGTIQGDVENYAEVAPGDGATTGTIAVTGDYTQGPSGRLSIDLGGPSAGQFDQLTVNNTADLDGDFVATLINSYQPANGTVFPVLTFANRTGDFASYSLPTYGVNGSITKNYTPTELDLIASAAPLADLSITKSGPSGVVSGQNIVYTVTVTNYGSSPATGVVVSDPTPANLTFLSNSGACTGPYPCSLGTLASGQTVTITSTYGTSPSFSGNVTNTATVSSSVSDPDVTNDSASAMTNVGAQADLSLTKAGTASAAPGGTVTYTITVSNAGPSPAANVEVADPTPTGLAFVSNSGACTTAFPCSLGTLASGGSAVITSTYTVSPAFSGASITNSATVSSTTNDPVPSNNTGVATTTIVQQADLAIAKSGPPAASPGGNIVYTITVSNLGPSAAASVVVSDPTPSGLTFVSNSGACTGPFPCSIGNLSAGAQATITATFHVPAAYAGSSVTNTATVSSAAIDNNGANDSASVTTPVSAQADLSIVKTGPAVFNVNQDITYTITVTNNGPLTAANTFVTDATPAGLTFVSNSGACTGAFPCALGTLTPGQSKVITATFHIPAGYAGSTVTNTASVSSSTADTNGANNTSSTTAAQSAVGADVFVGKSGPSRASSGSTITFTIVVGNNGPAAAGNVVLSDPTPVGLQFVSASGSGCTSFPCSLGTINPLQVKTVHATYTVQPRTGSIANTATVTTSSPDPQSNNNSSTATVNTRTVTCPTSAPVPLTPANGASIASPANLTWSSVPNATGYQVTITGNNLPPTQITTSVPSASVPLPNGTYTWAVEAMGSLGCANTSSVARTFTICNPIETAPVASAVAVMTTGQTYTVQWTASADSATYELQESTDAAFGNPTVIATTAPSRAFTKNVASATNFYYRVRGISPCGIGGPFSATVRVVVVPVPAPTDTATGINVPSGSHTPVTFQVFIPGLPTGTTSYVATVDKPWLQVTPTAGIMPPEGINLTVSADPSSLTDGTWTGTILVVYSTSGVTKIARPDAVTTKATPVSVHVVTPVTPVANSGASDSALVIPSVGHLAGASSSWKSDVRLANLSSLAQQYLVTFNGGSSKQMTLTVPGGATTALDDVVRNWYGVGAQGDSSNGVLTIQPVDATGKPGVSRTTAVSTRTYNATANGTLGQFIPATPFASFIAKAQGNAKATILSLQQLAQTDAFRTNLGLVEAANKQTSVLVTAFDAQGRKLFDLPVTLGAGEQRQLNSFLAEHGVTLPNVRVEVQVTDGDGRVTAYASVVDSKTQDPFLINGMPLDGAGFSHFVVPGVAAVDTGAAKWRSDIRIFNGGVAPQSATVSLYPSGAASSPLSAEVRIEPSEVKALDDVVQSLYNLPTGAGTLHIRSASLAPLVVTGRTYDQTANGTLGQFIPAVTEDDAIGSASGALQVLQVEESPRYRTNLAVAEVTGRPVTAEVTVTLADSKVSPKVRIPLGAYESVQLPILSSLGLGNTYNARVSVQVVEGDGKVTAYGSIIDRASGDATYVPAQQ